MELRAVQEEEEEEDRQRGIAWESQRPSCCDCATKSSSAKGLAAHRAAYHMAEYRIIKSDDISFITLYRSSPTSSLACPFAPCEFEHKGISLVQKHLASCHGLGQGSRFIKRDFHETSIPASLPGLSPSVPTSTTSGYPGRDASRMSPSPGPNDQVLPSDNVPHPIVPDIRAMEIDATAMIRPRRSVRVDRPSPRLMPYPPSPSCPSPLRLSPSPSPGPAPSVPLPSGIQPLSFAPVPSAEPLAMGLPRSESVDLLSGTPWTVLHEHKVVVCTTCKFAFDPQAAGNHKHHVQLSPEVWRSALSYLESLGLAKNSDEVVSPPAGVAPLDHLKLFDAFACTACSYICCGERTMRNHWSSCHPGQATGVKSEACKAQAFFGSHPKLFRVSPNLQHDQAPLLQVFLKDIAPAIDSMVLTTPPMSDNEVPPLLRVTRWHEHLGSFIKTPAEIKLLRELLFLPSASLPAWNKNLEQLVKAYMKDVQEKAKAAPRKALCPLMEYPVTSLRPDAWSVLDNDTTLYKYGITLRQFITAILLFCVSPPASLSYSLSLSPEQTSLAKDLVKVLSSPTFVASSCCLSLHKLVKTIMYPSAPPSDRDPSKWDSVLERLLAIYALERDGTFKAAGNVTQTFAQVFYFIRSAVLYEAYLDLPNRGNQLLQ
ncbi:hypothetical protein BJ165DRAFT_1531837 [Panaeolus papilionaceus]|nr:hypothetical protein BJ165DRAFT_1531837 [Panaeolus papilionaceus]